MKKIISVLFTSILLAGCTTDEEVKEPTQKQQPTEAVADETLPEEQAAETVEETVQETSEEPAGETVEDVEKDVEKDVEEDIEVEETGESAEPQEVAPTTKQEQHEVMKKAIEVAQNMTAHEGYFSVREERHNGDQYEEQLFDTTYQEDRSVGDEQQYLLHFNQLHEFDENLIDSETFIKPEVAAYTYDGEQQKWLSYDLSMDKLEPGARKSYFAPIDYLMLADGATIKVNKQPEADYEIIVQLNQKQFKQLATHAYEEKSFVTENLAKQEVKDATFTIYIQPETYAVTSVNTAFKLEKAKEEIYIAAYHQYAAYELVNPFTPPAQALNATGFSTW